MCGKYYKRKEDFNMLTALIIFLIVFSVSVAWLAYKGIENIKEHLIAFVSLIVSIAVIVGCSMGMTGKIEKTIPAVDEIPTGDINITELALDSSWNPNKEIARFILENEEADFITVEKNRDIYLLTVVCTNGTEELFVLDTIDMYQLLPYVEFIHQPNVE